MKKFLIFISILLLIISPAFSQVRNMQKVNLRFGLNGYMWLMYPEADYELNPAWLIDVAFLGVVEVWQNLKWRFVKLKVAIKAFLTCDRPTQHATYAPSVNNR